MSREVELGWVSWTCFASSCPSCSSTAVQRTLSLWLCPSTAVERAIVQCTSRWAMARGHRLNTYIVLAAVHGLSGLFRAVSAVEPSLCRPFPTLSPSLISHLASVDVKQQWRRRWTLTHTTAGRHTQHTVSQEPRPHTHIHEKTQPQGPAVTHSHSLRNTARVHMESQPQKHNTMQNRLNDGEHNTNTDTGGWTSCKVIAKLILINAGCSQGNESHPWTQYKNRS